jgi:hypothetical protein
MKIPLTYIFYFLLALLVGIIFSFGYVGIFQQHEPLQVELEQYQPITPPAPAVPTIAPAVQATSAFAPASAPRVIPTQVLPSITPTPVSSTIENCNGNSSTQNMTCMAQQMSKNLSTAFQMLGIALLVLGLLVVIISMMNGCSTKSMISGIGMIIAAAMFIMIGPFILQMMMTALPVFAMNATNP